jgi:AmiR/NasT family two-component response regulator
VAKETYGTDGRGAITALGQGQRIAELETTVRQLQTALDSRLVIERANGILAERFDLSIDDGFALLRRAARTSRRPLQELARDVVESPRRFSPAEIVDAVERYS